MKQIEIIKVNVNLTKEIAEKLEQEQEKLNKEKRPFPPFNRSSTIRHILSQHLGLGGEEND